MPKPVALLVVPDNNTTMEKEMNALCPDLAPFLVARVKRPLRALTVDDLPEYRRSTLEAVEPFLDRKPELVVYGCTAAGFLGGPTGNASMVEALKARTGAKVVSTAGAMEEVLKHEGVEETAVVTPYGYCAVGCVHCAPVGRIELTTGRLVTTY